MSKLIRNRASLEWIAIRDYCKQRQATFRLENDGDLDPNETAKIRGMIAFAQEILDLDKDEMKAEVPDETYLE